MATSVGRKQCAYKDGCKQMSSANCEGCSQALCTKHFLEHRRFLEKEMNEIISDHDQFKHTLGLQTEQPSLHPLIKEIDEWEKQSIVKIQQKANKLRQEVLEYAKKHLQEVSENLRNLSEKLKQGQEEDSFVETDLDGWKKKLDELKVNLTSPSTFNISQQSTASLVQDLSVTFGIYDVFERVSDNTIRIEDNGQLAIYNNNTHVNYYEVRGKNEYTSGQHEIRLRIEQSTNYWIFVGINCKSTPLQNQSYNCKSTYGWSSNNYSWSGGNPQQQTAIKYEMKTNDIIQLVFDCDNRKISMTNMRINTKCELIVDINACPFPWQLQVILQEPNCRVRILSYDQYRTLNQ